MLRNRRSLFSYALVGVALAIACGPQPIEVPEDDDDENGRGGTGATNQGGFGNLPSGGAFATGGFTSGGTATGGALATGGFTSGGTGGAVATGGTFPSGGAVATGGVAGTVATGGAAGSVATGGGAGTSTTSCDAAFIADPDGFVRAPGLSGCWHGYAYAGGDTGSTVTPTSFATCGMGCMLKVTGTVGPATAENMYVGVAYLGFNVNQPAGSPTPGTITPTGTSLQIAYTKTAGPAVIRAQITSAGGATRWCATLTASPATIPYTMFNTACWEPASGTAYAKQPIEAVQLVAPGDMVAAPLDMTLISAKDM